LRKRLSYSFIEMEKAKRGSGSLRKKKGAKDETDEEDLLQ
jgi:hypothetical protein